MTQSLVKNPSLISQYGRAS